MAVGHGQAGDMGNDVMRQKTPRLFLHHAVGRWYDETDARAWANGFVFHGRSLQCASALVTAPDLTLAVPAGTLII